MPDNVFNNYATSQGIPGKPEVLRLLNAKLYESYIVSDNFIYLTTFALSYSF
jgi:hypothetical protein